MTKKFKRVSLNFYEDSQFDQKIYEFLELQGPKASYIKNLIKEDMLRTAGLLQIDFKKMKQNSVLKIAEDKNEYQID